MTENQELRTSKVSYLVMAIIFALGAVAISLSASSAVILAVTMIVSTGMTADLFFGKSQHAHSRAKRQDRTKFRH